MPKIQKKQPEIACCFTSIVMALFALCCLICCLSFRLNAQDIYTSKNIPRLQLDYTIEFARPDGVTVQPGGLNSIWNYQNIVRLGQQQRITAFRPEDISGLKPAGTNVILFNFTTGNTTFLSTGPNSIRYLGEDNGDKQLVGGREPLEVDPLPIQLNQTISVNYDAQIISLRSPDSITNRVGRYSITADGNGRLFLPSVVNPFSCIRVTIIEEITDTVFIKDEPQYVAKTVQSKTVWYGEDNAIEHLVIIKGDVVHEQLRGEAPKDFELNSVYYSTSASQGGTNNVEEQLNDSLILYPNPAGDKVTVKATLPSANPITIKLYSILGELIYTQQTNHTDMMFSHVVTTDTLPSGNYLLIIEQSGIVIRKRLQIVH